MSVVGVVAPESAEAAPADTGKGRGRKKLVAVVLVLALAGGAWWWFMLRPAQADQAPEPGEVLQLEPIQVNLADGHYLRVGIALQASKDAGAELEGSKALDATIELFSGETTEDLAKKGYRKHLKQELVEQLDERYAGEVSGVYFTDFVTQ